MGYGHCVVAQTPDRRQHGKQLNILLTNMDLAPEKIVIDPMTGAMGYGIEYTYSVMERIRTAGLHRRRDAGDADDRHAGLGSAPRSRRAARSEAATSRSGAPESERGALLEIATAMSLLNAGADMLIMYHPEAARAVKRTIDRDDLHGQLKGAGPWHLPVCKFSSCCRRPTATSAACPPAWRSP